jgi:hypothetical protein
MPKMNLDPIITPVIELNHKDPTILLLMDVEWSCPDCGEHYCIDQENIPRLCLTCAMKRAGKTTVMMFGWTISKTATQILAVPPRPVKSEDGSS